MTREWIGRPLNDALPDFDIGSSGKGPPAGEHLVQHDAEREDVAPGVDGFAGHLLGRHIRERAEDGSGQCTCFTSGEAVLRRSVLAQSREAEIRQLGVTVPGDQDVLGLDIPMQNSCRMGASQSVSHIHQKLDDLPPRALTL